MKKLKSSLFTTYLLRIAVGTLWVYLLFPYIQDFMIANFGFGANPKISYTIKDYSTMNPISKINGLTLESFNGSRIISLKKYHKRPDVYISNAIADNYLLHVDMDGETFMETVKVKRSGFFSVNGDHQYTIEGAQIGNLSGYAFVVEFKGLLETNLIPEANLEGKNYSGYSFVPYGDNRYIVSIWNPTSVKQAVEFSIPGYDAIRVSLDFSNKRVLEQTIILE